jgi:hypothetical protein
MPVRRSLAEYSVLSVLCAAACGAPDEPGAPLGLSLAHLPGHGVTGAVLGPDGSSVCNFIPAGSTVQLRVLNPTPPPSFLGAQDVTCPANGFSIPLNPGTYRIRVQLPATAAIGTLPWRYLDPAALVVTDVGTEHQIVVSDGLPLGGSVAVDGEPVPGVPLTLTYDGFPLFGAAQGASGVAGVWEEFFGRSPMRLQAGVRYQASLLCDLLGARLVAGPPAGPFLFPEEAGQIGCTSETAPATRFSHDFTRLVVTLLAGDLGGLSFDRAGELGLGWGVQFPIAPGERPVHAPVARSHLFNGGLLVGLAPDRVLSGLAFAGQLGCGASCRDFGLDAFAAVSSSPTLGRQVVWRYSDAGSAEAVGFRVAQWSHDGARPADYVLVRFSIQNVSGSTQTFYAGYFADWDVDDDIGDDAGTTELDGALMVMRSTTEGGTQVGALLRSDYPVSGNYFLSFGNAGPLSPTDQVQALSGQLRNPTIGPGDNAVIHGVGPITLSHGETADVWLALVAGATREELLANAAAAEADVGLRRRQPTRPEPAGAISLWESVPLRAPARSQALASPICKRCEGLQRK